MSHYQTSLSFPIRRGNAYFLALRRVRTLAAIRRSFGQGRVRTPRIKCLRRRTRSNVVGGSRRRGNLVMSMTEFSSLSVAQI